MPPSLHHCRLRLRSIFDLLRRRRWGIKNILQSFHGLLHGKRGSILTHLRVTPPPHRVIHWWLGFTMKLKSEINVFLAVRQLMGIRLPSEKNILLKCLPRRGRDMFLGQPSCDLHNAQRRRVVVAAPASSGVVAVEKPITTRATVNGASTNLGICKT